MPMDLRAPVRCSNLSAEIGSRPKEAGTGGGGREGEERNLSQAFTLVLILGYTGVQAETLNRSRGQTG